MLIHLQPVLPVDIEPEHAVLLAGARALEAINEELGLAFDDWDVQYYTRLFAQQLGRDPTNVELFDIAQSNSEHRCSQLGLLPSLWQPQ